MTTMYLRGGRLHFDVDGQSRVWRKVKSTQHGLTWRQWESPSRALSNRRWGGSDEKMHQELQVKISEPLLQEFVSLFYKSKRRAKADIWTVKSLNSKSGWSHLHYICSRNAQPVAEEVSPPSHGGLNTSAVTYCNVMTCGLSVVTSA